MEAPKNYGDFTRQMITDVPADLSTPQAIHYRQTIPQFPEEGVYIYSFKEGRMIYAHGWEEVIGLPSDQISMLHVVEMTSPEMADFVHEINDQSLIFLSQRSEHLTDYTFTIEIKVMHEEGHSVPVNARVAVYEEEGGRISSIIGRFQINRNLRFGQVVKYQAYGPGVEELEQILSNGLFAENYISPKEKEALSLASKGFAFKEIAEEVGVSQSAIEKRIIPLYKRFGVRSLPHLVSFAYENHILPV